MGVKLSHHHRVVYRIDFTTLIAANDPRRNAGETHQSNKRIGIVLTKSAPALKQESVDKVVLGNRRRAKGIEKRLPPKMIEYSGHQRFIGAVTQSQLVDPVSGPRVQIAGKLQLGLTPPR